MIICWWNQGASSTESIISDGNSSEIAINAGQTFTGEAELNSREDVMVVVNTDQNGTLYLELSQDGSNWDTSLSFVYDSSRINPPHILVKGNRYFRVRFTNTSSTNQTHFRLQSYYGTFNKLTSPINGTVAENFDAALVRSTDYNSEVAMGKRQGRTLWNKFGYNSDVDSTNPEIVASWGGAFDPSTDIISTAQTFTIAYNNSTDGLGTTGALTLFFTYLDENFLSQTSMHTLGNTGSDVTSFEGLGINRVVVLSNGGDGFNNNTITITATTDATTQAQIPAENSVTQQCIFHTQINHTFLTDWLLLNALKDSGGGGNPRVTFYIYSWSRVTETRYEVFKYTIDTADTEGKELRPTQKFPIGGREVMYIVVETTVNNVDSKVRFSGIEERIL